MGDGAESVLEVFTPLRASLALGLVSLAVPGAVAAMKDVLVAAVVLLLEADAPLAVGGLAAAVAGLLQHRGGARLARAIRLQQHGLGQDDLLQGGLVGG